MNSTSGIRDTIVADLMVAADALDVAGTLVGEHFADDDDLVARIGVEITCAAMCSLAAVSTLRADQPALPAAWSA